MGGSGSKEETSATVISNLVATFTQKQLNSCTSNVNATQQILIKDCSNVDIENVNLDQLVSVDIECVIKSLQQAVADQSLLQNIVAEAKKLNIGLVSQIENLLSAGKTTEANEYIKTQLQESIKQVTADQVNNNISATQGIVASNCSNLKVIGVSETQTLEGTVKSVIASTDLSKILQNVDQKVKVKTSDTNKDFDVLLIIGGVILVVLILGLIGFMVTSKKK